MKRTRNSLLSLGLVVSAVFNLFAATGAEVRNAQHLIVHYEDDRCLGWPANGGIWTWGDEILVQYKNGAFKDKPVGSHDIDYDQPIVWTQSRSKDGGLTWSHEMADIIVTEPMGRNEGYDRNSAPELSRPLDFSNPDLILKFEWSGNLYYSEDRGLDWKGPFRMPQFDLRTWQMRTDYLVEDSKTALAFVAGSKERFEREENGGMVYMLKTGDGGLTWTKEARIGRLTNASADWHNTVLMPSTVRINETKLVTCLRNLTTPPKVGWIDSWVSVDNGLNWRLQSIPVTDEAGTTPPALNKLNDGRLVLTYGYRKPLRGPTSIRARISENDGRTWGREIVLRDGGGDEDIGYTRNAVRPDGKVVTIYYWNDHEKTERYIATTIWDPMAIEKK